MNERTRSPFEVWELLNIIVGYLKDPLTPTGGEVCCYAPLPQHEEPAKVLYPCRGVSKSWKLWAEYLILRDTFVCRNITAAEQWLVGDRGSHVKRLYAQPPSNPSLDIQQAHFESLGRILEACKHLTHIHWDCQRPLTSPSRLPQLKNLVRLDFVFTHDIAEGFVLLLLHTPVLEYLTIMGVVRDGEPLPSFAIPRSITTIALFLPSQRHLDEWISHWKVLYGSSLKYLVATDGGRAFHHLAQHVTKVYLRPPVPKNPANFEAGQFTFQLSNLPECGSGTLVYSSFLYRPTLLRDQFAWVEGLVLKTLGFGCEAEAERWNALLPHLEFVLDSFPKLKWIDLCDDFKGWRWKDEIREFVVLAMKRGIRLRYLAKRLWCVRCPTSFLPAFINNSSLAQTVNQPGSSQLRVP